MHQAKTLYNRYSGNLSEDRTVNDCLTAYRKNIDATNSMMRHADIVKTCSACATEKAGSCCMHDVEEWYDPILLLINLLMGVEFPDFREIPGHCIFVGSHGCKLMARYSFCVNYLCPTLQDLLGPSQTRDIMVVAGQELFSGWIAEKTILDWLNSNAGALSHP